MKTGKQLLHTIACLLGVGDPFTQTSRSEREALQRHARGRRRLVEIGVLEGANTRNLAEAMADDGKLFAIDPCNTGRLGISWGAIIARNNVRGVLPPKHVEFVRTLSHDAAKQLGGDFDFVFIDGDHSIEGIQRDWRDWASRISPGGIMALHDSIVPQYNPAIGQLGSCIFFESDIRHDARFAIVEQVDSLSVLRRVL